MYDPYAPLETPADDPYGNPAVPPAPKAAPAAPATSDYDMTFSEGVDIPDYTPSAPKPEPEPVRPPPAADMTVEEMSKPEPEQAAKPKPVTESQTASAESYTFPEYYADPDDPANKPKVKLTPEQRARRRKKIVVVAAVGALALAVGGYFTFKDKYYQLRLPSIMAEM